MAGQQGVPASVHAAAALFIIAAFATASLPTTVQSIGVCYGTQGSGLPSASDVVQLYQSNGITAMRIYSPDTAILQALRGSGIDVVVDETDLDALISDAAGWVQANVQPYKDDVRFRYIAVGRGGPRGGLEGLQPPGEVFILDPPLAVGNEVEGGDTKKILPAMQSLVGALAAAGLGGTVKVSTAVKMSVLSTSSPPSAGAFADPSVMGPVVRYLASTGSPLLANIYPYFAYRDAGGQIDLGFSLFQLSSTTVEDKGLTYTNLFDAMADAMYAAMEKEGASGVPLVVSESGWPSAGGGFGASMENAQAYNQNLIKHVGNGTPRKPGALETYIFAMFNEDGKPGDETEKHFGLFNGQDKSPVYRISFS